MITYLNLIIHVLKRVPLEKEPFSSLRKCVKNELRSCYPKYQKTFNNRAYIAAIRRGVLKGVLKRDSDGDICLLQNSCVKPANSLMCDAYRKTAENHREERIAFRAVVDRRGFKVGGKNVPTVLLTSVESCENDKRIIIDHVWVSEGRSFEPFHKGDIILFNARVRLYQKKSGMDYKLFYPTNVRLYV